MVKCLIAIAIIVFIGSAAQRWVEEHWSSAGGVALYLPQPSCEFNTLSRSLVFPEYGFDAGIDKLPYPPTNKGLEAPTEYIEKHLQNLSYKVLSRSQCAFSFTTNEPGFEVHSRRGQRIVFSPDAEVVVDQEEKEKEQRIIAKAKQEFGLDEKVLKRGGLISADSKLDPAQLNKILSTLAGAYPEYASELADRNHLEAELVPGTLLDGMHMEKFCLFFNRKSGRYFLFADSFPPKPSDGFYKRNPLRPWSKGD